ncbi:MAG: sugar phosphate isomerase/epimerase [Anaerolineae bacterium]|nr:sugar phosphate isomerase/epimerase [Phycisphaerae bacterium]
MKLCFSTLACPEWTLDQIVHAARENNIGGVDFRGLGAEIDVTKLPAFNEGLSETLNLFRRNDLQMPCLNTSVTLVSPPDRWTAMLEECLRTAELASKTETRFMRIFGGAVPKEMSREEARAMGHRHLRQLTKITLPLRVQILLETHDQWTTSAEVLSMIGEFDSAEVSVLWDLQNPFRRGETPAETVRALGDRIRHVHVKDCLAPPPGETKAVPKFLGEGDVPIVECVKALQSIGYEGWYCLEAEKRWIASTQEPAETIPQFAKFMRQI